MELTQERLKELLHYDPVTGEFFLRMDWKTRKQGQRIGTRQKSGYVTVFLGYTHAKEHYPAHRLAWFYMTGKWPAEQIDHINAVKFDNRWTNLREASPTQNNYNRPHRSNTSVRGIRKVHRRYVISIRVDGKEKGLSFHTFEAAYQAYMEYTLPRAGEFFRPE